MVTSEQGLSELFEQPSLSAEMDKKFYSEGPSKRPKVLK
jgi:hypothetical protein